MIKLDAADPRVHEIEIYDGQTESIEINFLNKAGRDSTTASSVTWDVTGPVTISNTALSASVASGDLVTAYTGIETGTATATFADGQVIVYPFQLRVIDTDCL